MEPSSTSKPLRLAKDTSYWECAALIIGMIIGSGIFVSPQGVLRNSGSPGAAFAVWIVTGVITTLESFCYIELGLTFPVAGAEYTYIKEGCGECAAFLYLWTLFMFSSCAGVAVLSLTFSTYFCQMFWQGCHPPGHAKSIVAATALYLITMGQCYNEHIGYWTSNLFSVVKMLGLSLIIVSGGIYTALGRSDNFDDLFLNTSSDPTSYVYAFFAAYWAYSGAPGLFLIIEEIREPLKANIIKSVLISMGLVIVIYLLTNLAYLSVLNTSEMLASDAVAMTFGAKLFSGLFWTMPLIVACSTFGSMNNGILAAARSVLAATRERHLPRFFSLIQLDLKTPIPAHLSKLVLGLILLSTSGVYDLIHYTSYLGTMASALSQFTLIRYRISEPNWHRPFKLPLVFPIMFLLLQLALLIIPMYKDPWSFALCFAIIASGLPIYFLFIKPESSPQWALYVEMKVTRFLQMLLDSCPEEPDSERTSDGSLKKAEVNEAFEKKE